MFKHYVCFPSAKIARGVECANAWVARGYIPVVMLDKPPQDNEWPKFDGGIVMTTPSMPFLGYYKTINSICCMAFEHGADLVTCIGDDQTPDPYKNAQEIAEIYFNRFQDGFGVMQSSGDPQGRDAHGIPAAARICGSPTFGIEWYMRAYGGRGAFCSDYKSFYADEDLWNVAGLCGRLYMNPNLTIFHNHWSWGHMKREDYHERAQQNWTRDKALFFYRKAEGFPGWEPIR